MTENKSKSLPKFNSIEEIVNFFDSHDLGEFDSELPEVNFDVDLKKKHYLVAIDEELMLQLLEVAREQKISVEMLVNSWCRDKLIIAG
jgi:CopG antitoxin of type II toxin-antitoxin system